MLRGEKLLTDLGLAKKAKTSGRHKDGGGLELRVDDQRARWVFRYTMAGRDREMGLGSYPAVTLAMARARRGEAREMLRAGGDPIAARKAPEAPGGGIPTFSEAARAYVEKHGKGWNATHLHQWAMTTGTYCDQIAGKPVDQITTLDIDRLLAAVHERAPVTAHRLRTRIAAVIDEAWMLSRWSETLVNPAAFKRLVPKRSTPVRHHPAIPFGDVPAFVADLQKMDTVSARALEFSILTATRTNETLGAVWSEIDTEARLWTIPAGRMKGRVEHTVPLSDRAIEIVESMREIRENEFVFPGRSRGGCLNPIALASIVRKRRTGATVHGFRSSFRDWAGDVADAPREIAEAALAHVVGGVEGAYRRGTALDRRRKLMDQWSAYCAGGQPVAGAIDLDTFRRRA
jgi:integrase